MITAFVVALKNTFSFSQLYISLYKRTWKVREHQKGMTKQMSSFHYEDKLGDEGVCVYVYICSSIEFYKVCIISFRVSRKKRVKKKLSSLFKLTKPVFYKRRFKPTTL